MMLKGNNLLCLLDLDRYDLQRLLDVSFSMKEKVMTNSVPKALEGKRIALYFEKPSTRTRISSELAISMMGGTAIVLSKNDVQLSRESP